MWRGSGKRQRQKVEIFGFLVAVSLLVSASLSTATIIPAAIRERFLGHSSASVLAQRRYSFFSTKNVQPPTQNSSKPILSHRLVHPLPTARTERTVLYLHIPKTLGTSVCQTLQRLRKGVPMTSNNCWHFKEGPVWHIAMIRGRFVLVLVAVWLNVVNNCLITVLSKLFLPHVK